MTPDELARHVEIVRELSQPGEALAPGAANSTTHNSEWWRDGEPTPARRRIHRELRQSAREAQPDVRQDRKAIVLAGPPGAGKSTVLNELLGPDKGAYLIVDADDFKKALLQQAIDDNSYETWIKPDQIRELEATGERFFPLEMASLVHEESSYIAKQLRHAAIRAGDNIVIDTVLSDSRTAVELGNTLSAAGYDVNVVDVEVSYQTSEERIRGRWAASYAAALDGSDPMGGRWVPSEYARDVFNGPDGRSRPEHAARMLAESCPNVTRYRVFRTDKDVRGPTVDLSRAQRGSALFESKVAAVMSRARGARTDPGRNFER